MNFKNIKYFQVSKCNIELILKLIKPRCCQFYIIILIIIDIQITVSPGQINTLTKIGIVFFFDKSREYPIQTFKNLQDSLGKGTIKNSSSFDY